MLKVTKLILILFLLPKTLLASNQKSIIFQGNQNNKPKVTTTITSKTINVKRQSGQIEFFTDVVVVREDTSFLADKMIMYYNKDKDNASSIDKILAYDNIKIFNEEFVVTGNKGSYNPSLDVFVVQEDVIFNNGTSVASGDGFVYNVSTKKSYLTGEKSSDVNSEKDNRVILVINDTELKDEEDKDKDKNKNQESELNKLNEEVINEQNFNH